MRNKSLRLFLASKSPRRRAILEDAGFECILFPSNSSESFSENLTIDENLCAVSREKARIAERKLYSRNVKDFLILAADTVVVVGGQVLGKPRNRKDARRMLGLLSGKIHEVRTAFTILYPDKGIETTQIVITRVGFRRLSRREIHDYLDSGESFDKSGGYGIQGIGSQFVNLVKGELLNVVGLPIDVIKQELRKRRWNVGLRKKTARRSPKNFRSRAPGRSISRVRHTYRG